MRQTTINIAATISTTDNGTAGSTTTYSGGLAGKSFWATIGVKIAFEIPPDTELVLVIKNESRDLAINKNAKANCKFERATTVVTDVGFFEVAARKTISDSWFFVWY